MNTNNSIETKETVIDPVVAGFGTSGSDVIIPKVSNIFGKGDNAPFLSVLNEDNKEEVTALPTIDDSGPKGNLPDNFISEMMKEGIAKPTEKEAEQADTTETTDTKVGRPKTDKDSMTEYLAEMIESKEFETYNDYKEGQDIREYLNSLTEKERKGLIGENLKAKKDNEREELRTEILGSLPGSLQYAAEAVKRGATEHDLQDIYQALLRVEQTRALDIADENDQEAIAYSYLQATGFMKGNPKKIQEQVEEWKENGKLESKVKEFKPELDQMQEQQVQYQLQQQEEINRQQEEIQKYYHQSVYEALKKGEIAGIKLTRKQQQDAYDGLTQVRQSPISGKPVNSLGAALDRIQYSDKPDYSLLIEADWLLNDPEGYRAAIMQMGKNQAAIDTEKKLKSAQQNSAKSTVEEQQQDTLKKNRIVRQKNMF